MKSGHCCEICIQRISAKQLRAGQELTEKVLKIFEKIDK